MEPTEPAEPLSPRRQQEIHAAMRAEVKNHMHQLVQQCTLDMLRPTADMLRELDQQVQELASRCDALEQQAIEHDAEIRRQGTELPALGKHLKEEIVRVENLIDQQDRKHEDLAERHTEQGRDLKEQIELVKDDVTDLDGSIDRAHQELEAVPKMKGDIVQTAARVTELDAKAAYLNDMLEGVNARQLTNARDVQAARAEGQAVDQEAKKAAKELRQRAKDNLNTMAGLAVRLKEAEDSIRSTKCDLLSQTAGIRELLPPMNESTRCLELQQQGHEQVHKKLEQQHLDLCQLVEGIQPQLHELSSKISLSENVFAKVAQEIAPVHEKIDGMRRASAAQLGKIEALAAQNTPERFNMLDRQVEDLVTKLEKQGSKHESLAEVSKDSRQRIDDLVKMINRMEAKNVDDRLAVLEDGTKNNTQGIQALETETRRLDSDLAPLGPEISRIMQKIELTDEQIGGLALGFEEARRKVVLGEDNMIARKNTPASMARKLPSLSTSGTQRGMAASPVGTETPRGTRPLSIATTVASS